MNESIFCTGLDIGIKKKVKGATCICKGLSAHLSFEAIGPDSTHICNFSEVKVAIPPTP